MAAKTAAEIPVMSIAEFYKDQSILITGATGFMGKVLVEKLLRSCPHVKTLYLLMRPKHSLDVRQRLEEMLNIKIFDRLRKEHPELLDKIVPISGDIALPDLGLSPGDSKLLIENVSIVFHSAATVKFDEPLRMSVQMNMLGTRRVIELSRNMLNLVAFIHVSTAYGNCDRNEITEVVYPTSVPPQKLIDSVEWMDDGMLEKITPTLIGGRPNTYTYTKALTENLILEECAGLPVAIIRPSIVAASWKEPLPGWIDNVNGPTGLLIGAGKGIMRSIHCDPTLVADLVPVDIPINLMVTVAWYTATYRPNSILIYNCTSGVNNQLQWGVMERVCYKELQKNPFNSVLWYPDGAFNKYKYWHLLSITLKQYFPAILADLYMRIKGKRPFFVRAHHKMTKAMKCLEYFTTHQWKFTEENTRMLLSTVSTEDQKVFNFDIRSVNWTTYMQNYCMGAKKFILKEDASTLPAARKNVERMKMLHITSQVAGVLFAWRLLMLRFKVARQLWFFCLSVILWLLKKIPGLPRISS